MLVLKVVKTGSSVNHIEYSVHNLLDHWMSHKSLCCLYWEVIKMPVIFSNDEDKKCFHSYDKPSFIAKKGQSWEAKRQNLVVTKLHWIALHFRQFPGISYQTELREKDILEITESLYNSHVWRTFSILWRHSWKHSLSPRLSILVMLL